MIVYVDGGFSVALNDPIKHMNCIWECNIVVARPHGPGVSGHCGALAQPVREALVHLTQEHQGQRREGKQHVRRYVNSLLRMACFVARGNARKKLVCLVITLG